MWHMFTRVGLFAVLQPQSLTRRWTPATSSLSLLLSKDWILFIVNCVCKTAFELFAISYEFKITLVGTKTLYTSYPKRSALRTPYKSLSFEKRNLKSFFWKIVGYANRNQWIRSTNFFEKCLKLLFEVWPSIIHENYYVNLFISYIIIYYICVQQPLMTEH